MAGFHFSWEAPEYDFELKSTRWYWGSIIIAVAILGIAAWQRNFLFGVFVVIAEVLLLVWAERPPRRVSFELTDRTLTVDGKKRYPLTDFESFSLEPGEDAEWSRVAFVFRKRLRDRLIVRVHRQGGPGIAAALRETMAEEPWEDSFFDALERLLGF